MTRPLVERGMRCCPGAVGAVLAAAVLAGCGQPVVISSDEPAAADPYDGPMRLPQDFADRASVAERGGAAARALECETVPYSGGGGDYGDGGLETVQDSPAEALEDWLEKGAFTVPDSGYRVEREEDGRVLLSYDVEGRTRAAVVVADGVRDWQDSAGWGVESWAGCDPVELPDEILDALEVELWEDADGAPVPVAKVHSYEDWCDQPGVTVVQVGPEWRRDQRWWGDPRGQLSDEPVEPVGASLPPDAEATGWYRDGRELWLAPDRSAAYLVSTSDPDDVERWPASRGISCPG